MLQAVGRRLSALCHPERSEAERKDPAKMLASHGILRSASLRLRMTPGAIADLVAKSAVD